MSDAAATIIAAVLAAGVGGLIGHAFGLRRARFERLDERRALVIAEITRLLGQAERYASLAVNLEEPDGPDPLRMIDEAQQAIERFIDYFIGHTLWLAPDLAQHIDAAVTQLFFDLDRYRAELDDAGQPSGDAGFALAAHIERTVQENKWALEARFREIVEPEPWDAGVRRTGRRFRRWYWSKTKAPGEE